MRRRIFFRTLLGAQFLLFLFLFGAGVYMLWLTRSADVLSDPDSADAVHGLRLSAAICLGTCIVWGASFYGILRRQSWGWWLGLVSNFFVFVIMTLSLFDQSRNDTEDYLIPAVFFVVTVIQLLSRPTSWTAMEIEQAQEAAAQSAGSGI